MSLDLRAVRYDIAAVLRTIPTFRVVDEYERRDRDLSAMPLVQVWRDQVEGPADNQPMAEFGKNEYTVTWRLRVFLAMTDDVEAQDQSDTVTVQLREAFDLRPTLLSNTVDTAKLVNVEPIPVIEGVQTPFMLVEATLVTEIAA